MSVATVAVAAGLLPSAIEHELLKLLVAWFVPRDEYDDYRRDLAEAIKRDGVEATHRWIVRLRRDFEARENAD